MTAFSSFINKKSTTVSDKLKKILEEENNKGYGDDRYWKPSIDKSGKGGAIIRFLPGSPTDPEALPFVSYYHHAFEYPKDSKNWYIEKSRTTINEPDPVSEYNRENWSSYDKDTQQARKRKLSYVSNIYVINDPIHPENNGKVFLFKYGKKIWDKLIAEVNPPEDTLGLKKKKKTPYEPWDYREGANFLMQIKIKDGVYWSYDDSEFDDRGPLVIDDNVSEDENLKLIEEIHNTITDLETLVSPDQFKSYDQLKTRLYTVLGLQKDEHSASSDESEMSRDEESTSVFSGKKLSEESSYVNPLSGRPIGKSDDEDEYEDELDDELAEFAKLAED